jgi:hypothetical protein
MRPVVLEVVAPFMSSMEMGCFGCGIVMDSLGMRRKEHRSCVEEYPEEWKDAVDYLAKLIAEISRLYRHRIRICMIDAQSPLGMWKQIRHRVFKFPAFIVNKKTAYVGWDPKELESLIDGEVKTTL